MSLFPGGRGDFRNFGIGAYYNTLLTGYGSLILWERDENKSKQMGGWDEVRLGTIDSSYSVSPGSTPESGDFRGSPGQYTLRNKHTSRPRSALFHDRSVRGPSCRRIGCILKGLSPSVNPLGEKKRCEDSNKDTATGGFVKKKVQKKSADHCNPSDVKSKGIERGGPRSRSDPSYVSDVPPFFLTKK
jgi:hypothetical protein